MSDKATTEFSSEGRRERFRQLVGEALEATAPQPGQGSAKQLEADLLRMDADLAELGIRV